MIIVEGETLADARGRMGVYTGQIQRGEGGDELVPHGNDGIMAYHAPRPLQPPPPPPGGGATAVTAKPITPAAVNYVVKYSGEWWQGHWHGKGKIQWLNGDTYEGGVCFSQRHGTGHYKWCDGRQYEGTWKSDERHGTGRLTWPNGSYYQGEFFANSKQGQGVYVDPKLCVRYEGAWERGVYQGQGTYTWRQAEAQLQYTGTFVNGKPHGSGREVNLTTGEVRHDGLWRCGEIVTRIIPETLPPSEVASRVAMTATANLPPPPPERETTVVNNQLWRDAATGRTALYRGLWDTKNQVPNGNGTAEFEETTCDEWRIYEGCFLAGRFHGRGRLWFRNGDFYDGNFDNGLRHGRGVYRWQDGREYSGRFVYNERHGKGTASYPDGSFYEGAFVKGQREGYGRFLFSNAGSMYEGNWKEGVYDGMGTLVHPDGTMYKGAFFKGLQHGVGQEIDAAAKVTYEGHWYQGEPITEEKIRALQLALESNGVGNGESTDVDTKRSAASTAVRESEDDFEDDVANCEAVVDQPIIDAQGNPGRYTGIVRKSNRQPHGVGRLVYADGKRIHEGFWKNGRKEGHGRCLFYPQGDFHEGEYQNNLRHGPGRYRWEDGRLYEGDYANDLRHGYGVFKYPTGEIYEGHFLDGRRAGFGRFVFDNKRGLYEGEWKQGKYEGKGQLVWGAGYSYVGEFSHGSFHGKGIKKDPNGNVLQEGTWDYGVFQPDSSNRIDEEDLASRLATQSLDGNAEGEDDDNASPDTAATDLAPSLSSLSAPPAEEEEHGEHNADVVLAD